MTPEEARGEAAKGALRPVYLLLGEESLLRDEVVAALREASLQGGLADFNEDKLTAGEASADAVIAACRTVPMMAPRRFVFVRGLDRWDGQSDGDSKSEPPLDKLAGYIEAPVDTTCLVLTAGKLDGRRKIVTLAKKKGIVVQCDALDDRALPAWIIDRAKTLGSPISHETAALLAELVGPELGPVKDAVERLSLFSGEGKPIDDVAVSECIARVRLADTWALVDAVAKKDLGHALALLADVYDPRDRGLPLLGALAWQVRQLAKLQAALAEGASLEESARRAGIFPAFRARESANKLRAFQPRETERWLTVLAETDVLLKSSRRSADAILEEMLTRLCSRR